nr:unnamed protein product [Naegleria fowleri]
MDLSFYRNQLTHLFFKESVIGCALMSFGEQHVIEKGVKLEELISKCEFLTKLLSLEFIYKENPEEPERYLETLQAMEKRQLISLRTTDSGNDDDNNSSLPKKASATMVAPSLPYLESLKLICSLLWPIIEGYWAVGMSLLYGMPSTSVTKKQVSTHERIQWWIEKFYFNDKKIQFFEACSMETIRNAISMFNKCNVLQNTSVVTIPASNNGSRHNKEVNKRKGDQVNSDSDHNKELISLMLPPNTQDPKLMEFVGEIEQFRKIHAVRSDEGVVGQSSHTETPSRHSRL